jgi:hypothetical protein
MKHMYALMSKYNHGCEALKTTVEATAILILVLGISPFLMWLAIMESPISW